MFHLLCECLIRGVRANRGLSKPGDEESTTRGQDHRKDNPTLSAFGVQMPPRGGSLPQGKSNSFQDLLLVSRCLIVVCPRRRRCGQLVVTILLLFRALLRQARYSYFINSAGRRI